MGPILTSLALLVLPVHAQDGPRPQPPTPDPPPPEQPPEELPDELPDDGDADLSRKDDLPPPSLRPWVGARAGVSLGNKGLGAGVMPELSAGLVLPAYDERLRPHLSVGWTAPVAKLSGEDPAAPDGWAAEVREHQLRMGIGLAVRFLDRRSAISPELLLRPEVWLTRTVTTTGSDAGGSPGTVWSTATEHGVAPGGTAAVGIGGALGPGHLLGHLGVAMAPVRGSLTGDTLLTTVDLSVGYRLEL